MATKVQPLQECPRMLRGVAMEQGLERYRWCGPLRVLAIALDSYLTRRLLRSKHEESIRFGVRCYGCPVALVGIALPQPFL